MHCFLIVAHRLPTSTGSITELKLWLYSGVKRGLVDSEYNLRREQCQAAVALKPLLPEITALRDVCLEHLPLIEQYQASLVKSPSCGYGKPKSTRCVELFKAGNIEAFGRLMNNLRCLRDGIKLVVPN